MAGSFIKDPDALVDYGCDWTAWLESDAIMTSSWSVIVPAGAPAGSHLIILGSPPAEINGKVTRVWVSDGVAGVIYELRNRITTVAGRRNDQTLKIACRQK